MSYSRCSLTIDELSALLREDAPYGDLTVATLGIEHRPAEITFDARDPMVVCGMEEAARLFELAGAEAVIQKASSGDRVEPGDQLLSASGNADALFLAWKVAQSLVESLSGVSTTTKSLVDQAGDTIIACTRKHLPSTKALMVKAIKAGGGIMHRLGLSESIMVAAEHRLFLDGEPADSYLKRIKKVQPEKRSIVEIGTVVEAIALIEQGCDVLQLEKLSIDEVIQVVTAAKKSNNPIKPVISAAGGIDLENVAEYAATGVDVLITSAPFFAKPRDVQVRFYTEDQLSE
jgi:molybdenum transport protein